MQNHCRPKRTEIMFLYDPLYNSISEASTKIIYNSIARSSETVQGAKQKQGRPGFEPGTIGYL
jgi:hypothetical protein